MKAVSNAGPLIALGKLGQLGLLLRLFDHILIARAVYDEVVLHGYRLGAPDAQAVDFLVSQGAIRIVDVARPPNPPLWAGSIDIGELETILLAQQEIADLVLIDDATARRAAYKVGLKPRGTAGLFLLGFRRGHLSFQELELLLQRVKAQPDLWISDRLCDAVLEQARREVDRQGSS